jgi:hypothetical protein
LEALFTAALFLGLRQGEILGLRWADVDLDARTLTVTQTLQRVDGALIVKAPKTEKSRRRLTLPPSVVFALRAHRDRQAVERQAAGDHWKESGLVFTTTIGTAIDPRNALRIWQNLLTGAGLPCRTFHVTRHTAVSMLINEGVPLKVIQEILGHSVLSTTADVYGHLYPQAFMEAAEAMERARRAPLRLPARSSTQLPRAGRAALHAHKNVDPRTRDSVQYLASGPFGFTREIEESVTGTGELRRRQRCPPPTSPAAPRVARHDPRAGLLPGRGHPRVRLLS